MHYLWNILHLYPVENFLGKMDVFHSSDWTQPPSDAPSVTTIHDLSPMLFPQEMGKKITSVHKARLSWVIKECQKIICVSKSTAGDMKQLFNLEDSRMIVVPEALPKRFDLSPTVASVTGTKSKWQLEDYIIAVGSRQPRKNYVRLANSFLNFKSKYRLPGQLVIVGGGGWGDKIPRHASIVQTGFLPDNEVLALVKGARALVVSSIYEGFGLPILLAWRQGVPVAVSDISSLPEVVGNAGILFDPMDEESIASGISLSIKKDSLLIPAATKRLGLFSWEETAKKTLSVYQSLC